MKGRRSGKMLAVQEGERASSIFPCKEKTCKEKREVRPSKLGKQVAGSQ